MQTPGNSRALVVAALVVLLALTPLLYVLSLGPALVLAEQRVISEQTWKRIYFPVLYAAYQTEITKDALKAYLQLWIHVEDLP